MTPEGWWETTLGSLSENARGVQIGPFGSELHASDYLTPGSRRRRTARWAPRAATARDREEEGVPVIMPKDLIGGMVSATSIARVSEAKASELSKHRVRAGDVLFARRGEIGRCALVRDVEDGWLCGTGCVRVRLRVSVEPRFLIQRLRWRPTVSWLRDQAVGQTMPSINRKILERLPLDLPPLAEQEAVAKALETVDEALLAAQEVVEQIRRLRDAVLGELLAAANPAPGPPDAESRPPDGWRVMALGKLCTFTNGRRFPAREWSEVGLPIIRIQNLNGSRDFKYFAGYAKPGWLVEPGELLYAWAGTKGVSFGPCLWDGPKGVLNQHIFRVRPKESLSKVWLCEVLKRLTRQIEEKAHGFKASLVHVRKKDIVTQRVLVPPYEEQRRITERSRQLADQERAEAKVVERMREIRRGLQDDLFAGHVRTL